MNAEQARKLSEIHVNEEDVRRMIDAAIEDAASNHHFESTSTRVDCDHDPKKVLESLRKDGFLCRCTLFKLHDYHYYQYEVCWAKYKDEKENEKLRKKYEDS